MEIILAGLAAQLLPVIGILLAGLATWAVAILKKKTGSDVAKNALDQVNQVVGAVVGQVSQTMAEGMKSAAAEGKLTDEQKTMLKNKAVSQITALLSEGVKTAAGQAVSDLQGYINQKIEEQVLAQKK